MGLSLFHADWRVQRLPDGEATPVVLPHDAMLGEGRSPVSPSGGHGAYFLGGAYRYQKTWHAPRDLAGKQVSLLFEGVYRHSQVFVNGHPVGGAVGGYTEFEVRIDPELVLGADNLIEVTADNSRVPNARWYTGSGIYRPVWLRVQDPVHIVAGSVRFRTLSIGDTARVDVAMEIANPDDEALDVHVTIGDTAATARTTGANARLELAVPAPLLWSAERPHLYDATIRLSTGGRVRDEHAARIGLRTIEVSGRGGLRVNGVPTLLRGANVHHDSGVLGAATFRAAEFRRVRILKENGFNAIRSAHNPASRDLLDACDELGMYVMDELYDGWYDHKSEHDDAPHFAATWQADAGAMVVKGRNHPCVIMYSIGNENSEPATPYGVETARRLAEHVRALDPDRPVTMGVNLMAATLSWPTTVKDAPAQQPAGKAAPPLNSTMVNVLTNQFGRLMKTVPRLKRADKATRAVFDLLDVAGYNYGTVRYETDARLHPDRVIVGTETMPGDIAANWALIRRLPNVIGDFIWSGWDYLGEAGIGTWAYGTRRGGLHKPYPQLVAGCGAIDITGVPGAPAYLAQAVWGLLDAPVIAVRPPDVVGRPVSRTAWRSTDAVPSWSWRGCSGLPTEIEVYSADDEVELLINGQPVGRRPAGRDHGFVARFPAVYQPGEITAVGYHAGIENGRSSLHTAGMTRLRLTADDVELAADGHDLAFVQVELADENGVPEMLDDDLIQVSVDGPATLAGFGSAAPATEESFTVAEHSTYRGRALAVVRAGHETGDVVVTATSRTHGTASIQIKQVEPPY
ncbi:glycoside hydrolase family 2 TIM barrel-domain containing protein [Actinoplanes rectilineatus]|uniref:glycoside hydrolase family 2 TIM barrel-domain containing protein n=1 Tax=Actinoplanes rectilineatus TaxID=113571 RepID=UPI000695F246|nr:glycoside hydrolase family 2 TIM barrel-domain containing protein [Actinoplanes rectilineatus]